MQILIKKYQGTIYPEGNGYTGAIDIGYDGQGRRERIKRKGRTKEAVKDKLIKAVDELELGIEISDTYTVGDAVRGWLAEGTKDLGEGTVKGYRIMAESNLIPLIGAYKLRSCPLTTSTTGWTACATSCPRGACKRSTRSCDGPSGRPRPRPGTRSCATLPTWCRRRRAARRDGPARP